MSQAECKWEWWLDRLGADKAYTEAVRMTVAATMTGDMKGAEMFADIAKALINAGYGTVCRDAEYPENNAMIQAQRCSDCDSPCRCVFDIGMQFSGRCCVHGEAKCGQSESSVAKP